MAVRFDASGEYISVPAAVGVLDQTVAGVLVLFKTGTVGASNRHLFEEYRGAFNRTLYGFVYNSGDANAGKLSVLWRTTTASVILNTSSRVDDNQWHTLYLRRTATNAFEFLLDGSVFGTSTLNPGTDTASATISLGNLVPANGTTQPLVGDLARFVTWRGECPTWNQVNTFLSSGVPPGSPAAWYEMFEGASDWSGKGQHGTTNGAGVTFTAHPTTLGFDGPQFSSTTQLVESHGRLADGGGGKVYIVGHTGTNLVIRRSTDYGANWGSAVTVAAASSNYPMQYGGLYAEGDVVHLLTAATDPGGENAHLDYRRSTDGGQTFGAPVRITASGQEQRRANIYAEDGIIYVFGGRVDNAQNYGGAFVFRSADNGQTWSATVVDSAANAAGGSPWGIAVGSVVHFAYARKFTTPSVHHKTYYVRSTDGGLNYSTPAPIGDPTEGVGEARQRIEYSDGVLICCWEALPPTDIKGVRSTDDGATWGSVFILADGVGNEALNHHELSARPGGRFYLPAKSRTTSETGMLLYTSSDGGLTWAFETVAIDRVLEDNQSMGFAGSGEYLYLNTTPNGTNRYARMLVGGAPGDGTAKIFAGIGYGPWTWPS